ncbi:MAG: zf-HC2 domain-containing protein [Cyanobacteria bacterium P01_E01_bin.34]
MRHRPSQNRPNTNRLNKNRPNAHLTDSDWELLSTYVDGEATPAERQQVEQKLRDSPDYRRACSHIFRLQDGFSQVPIPPTCDRTFATTDDMATAVLQELERSPITGTVSPIWFKRCATVAAGVAILFSASSIVLRLRKPSHTQLLMSLEEPPIDIPAVLRTPELTTSTHKAESYLLSPGTPDNAYSILLTDI